MRSMIEAAFANPNSTNLNDVELINAVQAIIAGLDDGSLRVAEKKSGDWVINEWVKKAILLYFRMQQFKVFEGQYTNFWDKIPLKYADYTSEQFIADGARIVPPATVRKGVFVAANCVLMPSYLNIGAYIDEGSMIDIWATIGSCAQIGKRVHISGNVCIGGVLEPLQANPVIIEDGCFVGAGSMVVEGVIVEENSVIGMGVKLGRSTKIFDRATGHISYGRIPAGSVVVPGSLPSESGKYNLDCAVIVKKVDAATRAKVSINELLREV